MSAAGGGAGPTRRGYLGLGSNEGDRVDSLRAARDRLAASDGLTVIAGSSAYETEPQAGAVGQRDFVNACLEIETTLEPEELMSACKAIERELGRDPARTRHAARPIDIDLLLLGDLERADDDMSLPHPDITARRFVLVPLLELAPALRLPDDTELAAALERTEGQRVERLGPL